MVLEGFKRTFVFKNGVGWFYFLFEAGIQQPDLCLPRQVGELKKKKKRKKSFGNQSACGISPVAYVLEMYVVHSSLLKENARSWVKSLAQESDSKRGHHQQFRNNNERQWKWTFAFNLLDKFSANFEWSKFGRKHSQNLNYRWQRGQ